MEANLGYRCVIISQTALNLRVTHATSCFLHIQNSKNKSISTINVQNNFIHYLSFLKYTRVDELAAETPDSETEKLDGQPSLEEKCVVYRRN